MAQTIREGRVISGKYSLLRRLSRGGMGSVWAARHLQLDSEIAIKFIDPALVDSARVRARFDQEAKASARLRSPHVVHVHDYGVEDGTPYIVMELLHGEDLGARLQRAGRLPLREAARIVRSICQALRAAHFAGIVHRDLKPSNVFLARDYDEEVVKVLDFGIAKALAGDVLLGPEGTQSGALMGSPHYMSPEQVRSSKRVDHRADLWSVGVILFRSITGQLPFPSPEVGEVLLQICLQPIPTPSSIVPDLGPEIDRFFRRALARDVEERFQSARDFADALFDLVAPAEVWPATLPAPKDAPTTTQPEAPPAAPQPDGDDLPTLAGEEPGSALRPDAAIPAGEVSTAALAWRYGGLLRLTVIAKASFAFARDAAMPRVDPAPIFGADVHHGKNPARSVRFASDRAPYLSTAQILFTGEAHAPGGEPVTSMEVRLGLFDGDELLFDKTLLVRQPQPFVRIPLVYEKAFGGHGFEDNPCGTGSPAGSAPPAIVDPSDPSRAVGLGPIGQLWPARSGRLGGLSRRALEAPIVELPDDFDWAYYQAAPADQQIAYLSGSEWIYIEGLHPRWPRAYMQLPGARGLARIHGLETFGIEEGQPLVLHADMLSIDGDAMRCTLTFRGAFEVPSEEALAAVRVVAGVELPGQPIAWPELPSPAPAPPVAKLKSARTSRPPPEATISLNDADFESAQGHALAGVLALPFKAAPRDEVTVVTVTGPQGPGAPALPFHPAAPGLPSRLPPSPPPSPRRADPISLTMDVRPGELQLHVKKALPFGAAPSAKSAGPAAPKVDVPAAAPKVDVPAAAPKVDVPAAAPKVDVPAAAPKVDVPAAAPKVEGPVHAAEPAPRGGSSPWAEPPAALAEPPRAPPRPAPKPSTPGASPALKQGLYGRFGGKGSST